MLLKMQESEWFKWEETKIKKCEYERRGEEGWGYEGGRKFGDVMASVNLISNELSLSDGFLIWQSLDTLFKYYWLPKTMVVECYTIESLGPWE